jgi:hypothetical protein
MKVKLYYVVCTRAYRMDEVEERWSLQPWSGDTSYYEGYTREDGEFILPDGYTIGKDQTGGLHLWFGDQLAPLWTTTMDTPTVYHPDYINGVYLKRAS